MPASASTATFPYPGGVPAFPLPGSTNGIVWIEQISGSQVVLHAYDATNLANELYSSAAVNFGAPTKFAPPTVCNGKVFVAAANSVGVFGLIPSSRVDFNGDGNEDVLWRNSVTGDTWIWLMNGTSVEAAGRIAIVDPSWRSWELETSTARGDVTSSGTMLRSGESLSGQ